MAYIPTRPALYLEKFENSSIACGQYAIAKLGIENRQCFLKMDEYIIVCAAYQLSFKRAIFLASLSKQELVFFQKYVNQMVGLSISFNQGSKDSVKLFIRCNLLQIGQMKGRDNVGLFVVDFKTIPDDLVTVLGQYLEHQILLKALFEDLGTTSIRMNAAVSKVTGYNMYATVNEPGRESKRIQLYNFNTKTLEHLETNNSFWRPAGTTLVYQLYFQKYRFSVVGKVLSNEVLQNGILKITSSLDFSPELVEIVDDYWSQIRSNSAAINPAAGIGLRH